MQRPRLNPLTIVLLLVASSATLISIPSSASADSSAPTNAPMITPSQVLVVYNSNITTNSDPSLCGTTQDSKCLAAYYASARGIPVVNVIGVPAPTNGGSEEESISHTQMISAIVDPIQSYLASTTASDGTLLKNKIDYIVLIKGIPLTQQGGCQSVDSSLAVSLFQTDPNALENDGSCHSNQISNPYYDADQGLTHNYNFVANNATIEGHDNYGQSYYLSYLVTRLDGYTVDDVKGIIDRAVSADTSGKKYAVIDLTSSYVNGGSNGGTTLNQALGSRGYNTVYNAVIGSNSINTAWIAASTTGSNPVIEYASDGTYDPTAQVPHLYVSDTGNNRVEAFNTSGTFVGQGSGAGCGSSCNQTVNHIVAPQYLSAEPGNGSVWVANTGDNGVVWYTAEFGYYGPWTDIYSEFDAANITFHNPDDVLYANGLIYVTDTGANRVLVFGNNTGLDGHLGTGNEGSGNGDFNGPAGMATDSSGNIYVVDSGNNRIEKFTYNGTASSTFALAWGAAGSSSSQLNDPTGIAIDASNNIYIADTGNNRIEKFNASGAYLATIGTYGTGNGQLNSPYGVSVDALGNVYVADTDNNRIEEFSTSNGTAYTYAGQFGSSGTGEGQFNHPKAVLVNPSAPIFPSEWFSGGVLSPSVLAPGAVETTFESYNAVSLVTPCVSLAYGQTCIGDFLHNGGSGALGTVAEPMVSGVDDPTVWMPAYADGYDFAAAAYMSLRYLNFVNTIVGDPLMDINPGKLISPTPTDPIGGQIVTFPASSQTFSWTGSFTDDAIARYRLFVDGALVQDNIAGTSTTLSLQSYAQGNHSWDVVAVDGSGHAATSTSVTFSLNPPATVAGIAYLKSISTFSDGSDSLSGPSGLTTDAAGNVYVADTLNSRIVEFNPQGTYVNQWSDPYGAPVGVAVDTAGDIYIADENSFGIVKIATSTDTVSLVGTGTASDGYVIYGPSGVQIDSAGNLYVEDPFNFSHSSFYKVDLSGNITSLVSSGSMYSGGLDSTGDLFGIDETNMLKKFDRSGALLFSSPGENESGFNVSEPNGIALDSAGNIYVSEDSSPNPPNFPTGNDIQVLTSSGTFSAALGSFNNGDSFDFDGGNGGNGVGISIDPLNHLWITDSGNNRIVEFSIEIAPIISSIASSTTQTTATITWTTDQTASSTVNYGATSAYGTASTSPTLVTSHSIALSGLTPGTTYHFQVGGANSAGAVSTSSDQTFTTAAAPVTPPALTVQAAIAVGTSTATLNGTITSNNNASSTIKGFNYGLTTAYGSVASTTGTFGTGSFSQSLTGLTPGTTYHFQAFATNSGGTGTSSDATFITNALGAPIISSIASSTAQTTATITWTTDQTASSTVNYGATSAYGTASTSPTLVTSHSIALSGLTPGTTYHFQVGGANSAGAVSTSTDLVFTTSAVPITSPALTTSAASSIGTSTAILNGAITATGNASSTVRGFTYGLTTAYGATTTENGTFGVGAFASTTSNLSPGVLYHFRGYATNSAGTGYGGDQSFTTSVPPDTTPPTVALIAPALGATITGSAVTLTATSSDNVGVTGVQFEIDGVNTGASGTTSPYSIVWNSTSVSDGAHTIAAVASDGAGNMATSVITVAVSNGTARTSPIVSTGGYGISSGSGGLAIPPPLLSTPSQAIPCLAGDRFNILTGTGCSNFGHTTHSPLVANLTANLQLGLTNPEVRSLQQFLNATGFPVASSGAGSLGHETTYFGSATRAALIRFQRAKGITPPSGYFGPITRAYIAAHGGQ